MDNSELGKKSSKKFDLFKNISSKKDDDNNISNKNINRRQSVIKSNEKFIKVKSEKKDNIESPEIKKRSEKRTKTYKFNFDINQLKFNLIERKKKQKEKEEMERKLQEEKKNKKNMFFSNMIKKELEEPNVEDINWYYFNKYHSVSLAKKATERRIMEYLKEKEMGNSRTKTAPKLNKNKKMILPNINKDKNAINQKNLKKPLSMNKIRTNQFLDIFGFRRRAQKTRFLY